MNEDCPAAAALRAEAGRTGAVVGADIRTSKRV
jgi:hypothetical protein